MKESTRKTTGVAEAGDAAASCGVCRVCLRPCAAGKGCPLFSTWTPPEYPAAAVCIGERLAQLAGVQMREGDGYPQAICAHCLGAFTEAHLLLCAARRSDRALRACGAPAAASPPRLPGPIRFDPSAVNAAPAGGAARRRAPRKRGAVDVDTAKVTDEVKIKEEVVSEEETEQPQTGLLINPNLDIKPEPHSEPELDIKIEPEELVAQHHSVEHTNCLMESPPPLSNFIITGTFSMDPGQRAESDKELIQSPMTLVKEELDEDIDSDVPLDCMLCHKSFQTLSGLKSPMTLVKEELDEDIDSDVPLDCMLCHKSFQTLSGLKAHVITSHSYKSVLRKRLNGSVAHVPTVAAEANPRTPLDRLACSTCSKAFTTAASRRLHEAVHETACARCGERFATFVLRARHAPACPGPSAPAPAAAPAPAPAPAPPAARQLKRKNTAEPSRPQSVKKKKCPDKYISKEQGRKNKERRSTRDSKNTSKTPIKTKRHVSKKKIEKIFKKNVQALLSQILAVNVKAKNGSDTSNVIVPSEAVDATPVVSKRLPKAKITEDDINTSKSKIVTSTDEKNCKHYVSDVKKNHENANIILRSTLNLKVEQIDSNSDNVLPDLKENLENADTILGNTLNIKVEKLNSNLPIVESAPDINDPVKILDEANVSEDKKPIAGLVDVDIKKNALLASNTKISKDNSRQFISIDPLPVVGALSNQVIGDV